MSQTIQDRWDKRLSNWSLWIVSGGGASNASPYPAYRDYIPERGWWYAGSGAPQAIVGEALDVDAVLVMLQGEGERGMELYMAVRAVYVWTGSLPDRATALGIHPDTLRDRVTAARYRLDDLDLQRRRGMTKPQRQILAFAA